MSCSECSESIYAKGWCLRHYMRAYNHEGDPLAGRIAPGVAFAYFLEHLPVQTDACKVWPYGTVGGRDRPYGLLRIAGKKYWTHWLACFYQWGPMPGPNFHAAHGPCHTTLCWNGKHVSWKLPKDNSADKKRDGTHLEGEALPHAKLTADIVTEIRRRYAAGGVYQRELAEEFGVTQTVLQRALAGKTNWKHVASTSYAPLRQVGENTNGAVLTEAEVLSIRSRYAAGGILQKELAAEHGVNPSQISVIVNGKSWKHLLPDQPLES